jgi:hypothetical protein
VRIPDDDPGLADEFDRACTVYFREWEDKREEDRLKRVLTWFMSGQEKGKGARRKNCAHERFETLPGGELKCRDCGEVGN